MTVRSKLAPALPLLLAAAPAAASPQGFPPSSLVVNSGDTAWLAATGLLALLAILPGVMLRYGGFARVGHALSAAAQCAVIASVVALVWVAIGYSLVFTQGSPFIGASGLAMLRGLGEVFPGTSIPESVYVWFQLVLATLAAALMAGAWIERARFGWAAVFAALWLLVVYAPIAHWLWGGGWLVGVGAIDFGGGLVIHASAGCSALVAAALIGRRTADPRPHAPALAMAGGALLWLGLVAVSGGSSLAANFDGGAALVNAHLAASAGALVWASIAKLRAGKPLGSGLMNGAIAGLAAIAAGANAVGAGGAMLIGAAAALVSYGISRLVVRRTGIDDSLSVFAVHGGGGMTGAALVAIFAAPALGGVGYPGDAAMLSQLASQLIAVGSVFLWACLATAAIAWIVGLVLPMRATAEQEAAGLDTAQHGEKGWDWD